jgi:hypothetical protein
MTCEGSGEMFEGDSANMCAGKFPLVSMGTERRVLRVQIRERGHPSALTEICQVINLSCWGYHYSKPNKGF